MQASLLLLVPNTFGSLARLKPAHARPWADGGRRSAGARELVPTTGTRARWTPAVLRRHVLGSVLDAATERSTPRRARSNSAGGAIDTALDSAASAVDSAISSGVDSGGELRRTRAAASGTRAAVGRRGFGWRRRWRRLGRRRELTAGGRVALARTVGEGSRGERTAAEDLAVAAVGRDHAGAHLARAGGLEERRGRRPAGRSSNSR